MTYRFTKADRENLELARLFVLEQLHRKILLSEICRVAQLNRSKLNQAFKKYYGKNLRSYLSEQRMQRARTLLLETELAIWEVAEQTGYTHCSNFLAAYKKFYGRTPGAERKAENK